MRTAHGSIELHGTLYFPCAMALRLMPCSPRRRIRLVTVVWRIEADQARSGRLRLRQLGTSNGCQDHTVLPYATAPFVLRAGARSRITRPAITLARRRCRVHRIPSRVRDDRETPLLGWDGTDFSFDLPDGLSGIFFAEGLDRISVICPTGSLCRHSGACEARARNPSDSTLRREIDSGLVLRTPRNDGEARSRQAMSGHARAFARIMTTILR